MEELSRFELLIGKKSLDKLKEKKVLVLGLGGVGSYAVEALVRSGIGFIILVDCDIVDITNINRQLIALKSNIGKYKVDEFEKRIQDIRKDIQIKKINKYITKENISILFKEKIDYVIDACDAIQTKIELIKQCHQRKIPLISSMGMGKRMDPTQLQIIDIRKTTYDPVAKIIRKKLKEEKIDYKVTVVCSKESPILIKSNLIPSNAFVPAVAGLYCASYVINEIIKES